MAKTPFPLGFNIDGQDLRPFLRDNDYAGLKRHLIKTKPAALLIMDDLALAVRIKNDWLPDCHVIHRNYSTYEGSEWQTRPPQVMVNQWKQEGHKEIIRYLTNEPSFDAASAKTFAGREAETMKLAREAGFTVVALNTSVGSYERQWVQDGKFDAILKAAVDYGHYLGCHEYMSVCLPAALIGDDKLGDKLAMQPENWQREKITAGYHDFWYLFRHVWLVERSMQVRADLPKFILTEFGYDDIRNDGNAAVFDELKAKYGLPQYTNDMRGVNTYERVWDDYYPGLDHNDVIRQQLEWWLEVKPDWIIGACLFGINADWEDPEGHDWSADVRRGFFPVLEEMSAAMADTPTEVETTPEPDLTGVEWRRGTVRRAGSTGHTNRRKLPDRFSDDMGDIRQTLLEFDIAYVDVEKNILWEQQGGSYMWVAIRLPDTSDVSYVVKRLVVIEHDDPEPEPAPEPTPDPVPEPPEEPPPPPPTDDAAIEALVNSIIDKRLENLRDHISEGAIPRTMSLALIGALRWVADTLEASVAQEVAESTTAISNAVNAAVDDDKSEKVVKVLNTNSIDVPVEPPGDVA